MTRTLDNRDLTGYTDYQQDRIEAFKRSREKAWRDYMHLHRQINREKARGRKLESTLLTVQTECARLAEELRGVKAVELSDRVF